MEAVRQHQVHILDELKGCRKSLDGAFREFSNCRALPEATWADLKEVSLRHTELKRKADDDHERTLFHGERFRRAIEDNVMAEEELNDSLKTLLAPLTRFRVACQVESRTTPNILKTHWR